MTHGNRIFYAPVSARRLRFHDDRYAISSHGMTQRFYWA
ncbi:hypothetical protein B0G76_1077 [Paraburkholderia sp. BL23I1N1]|nr:hypothetical protein B0G76_1077 [Paraburkholderia sp. BL23I1N1]